MAGQLIHIAIIEPSDIICEGLANVLLKSGFHFNISRPDNLDELEKALLKHHFDVVLINPALVQFNTRSLEQLRRSRPSIQWTALVYSYFDREMLALFDNVLQITDPAQNIVSTLNRQANIPAPGNDVPVSEPITERETEVLVQLAQGLSNKEIADKLNISIHTVVSHRKNIVQKTGIRSQAGLTIYAISNKIISLGTSS